MSYRTFSPADHRSRITHAWGRCRFSARSRQAQPCLAAGVDGAGPGPSSCSPSASARSVPLVRFSCSPAAASRPSAAASCARISSSSRAEAASAASSLARGFHRALRQATLEELAKGGVLAQPPFSGVGRERLLECLGQATVDDPLTAELHEHRRYVERATESCGRARASGVRFGAKHSHPARHRFASKPPADAPRGVHLRAGVRTSQFGLASRSSRD